MTDLVERLRTVTSRGCCDQREEAADEIEKLRGEVTGAKAKIANYAQSCITLHNEIDKLKAERDAAVKLLEDAVAIEPDCPCQGCADKRVVLKQRIIDAAIDAAQEVKP